MVIRMVTDMVMTIIMLITAIPPRRNLVGLCAVIADAATSVLAIAALFGNWLFGWAWARPPHGRGRRRAGRGLGQGLIADTAKVLLDREMDHPVVDEIREVVETGADAGETRIADLHVWRVGKQVYSCAMTVVTHDRSLTPDLVRQRPVGARGSCPFDDRDPLLCGPARATPAVGA